jgi:ATP-dependent Clp protease ATP-binding subunit ClpA
MQFASVQNIRRIVDVRLKEVDARLADRHITLNVDENAKDWLAENGIEKQHERAVRCFRNLTVSSSILIKFLG